MVAQLMARLAIGLLVWLVTAAVAGDAGAESRPPYGGSVVGSLLGEPVSLDPVQARGHAEVTLVSMVFDTLYRTDAQGRARPHLAASLPRVSSDRKTARIPLVRGAAFHDGTAVEVDDVVASLRRLAADKRSGWLLAPVKAIASGEGELVLELRRDTPELTSLLSAPQASVTPGGKPPRTGKPLGSGAYRLANFDRPRRRVVLTAFDGHFAGRPYLDTLELRWYRDDDEEARQYERGLTHFSLRGAAAFSGHRPKYPTDEVESPATVLVYVGFGRAHPAITGSRDFRRALSLALARTGFKSIGSGERVVPSIYPDAVDIGGVATERAHRSERLSEAKAALARAAARVPELARSRPELEVIIDASRHDDREVAEKVVAALYRLGVRARITELPAVTYARRVEAGTSDLFIGSLSTPAPSAELAIAAAFAAGGDDWTERMLAKARLRPEGARAWFDHRLPIVPLFHRALRVHHRGNLRGVNFDRLARLGFADVFEHGKPGVRRAR